MQNELQAVKLELFPVTILATKQKSSAHLYLAYLLLRVSTNKLKCIHIVLALGQFVMALCLVSLLNYYMSLIALFTLLNYFKHSVALIPFLTCPFD